VLCYARFLPGAQRGRGNPVGDDGDRAANLSGTGASTRLDLRQWQGIACRENAFWVVSLPGGPEWFVLPARYGFYGGW